MNSLAPGIGDPDEQEPDGAARAFPAKFTALIYLRIIPRGGDGDVSGASSGKIKRPNKVQPLEEVSLVNGIITEIAST